jgi:hypothetical protein
MRMTCACCGSEKILAGVSVLDRGKNNYRYNLTLETFDNPNAILMKGAHRAEVLARVCERCGHVMLFANPRDVTDLKEGQTKS